jgi:hypothetical protein
MWRGQQGSINSYIIKGSWDFLRRIKVLDEKIAKKRIIKSAEELIDMGSAEVRANKKYHGGGGYALYKGICDALTKMYIRK